jgi:hypothetical protein
MLHFSDYDVATLQIGPLQVNVRNNKIAIIESQPKLQLAQSDSPLRVPFGASSYQDLSTDRLTINVSASLALANKITEIDNRILYLAFERSVQWFGKELTMEQLTESYTPLIRTSENYDPLIRLKMNTTGRKALRCFDAADGSPREYPDDFRSVKLAPGIELSHIWFSGKSFGCICLMTHALVIEENVSCPLIIENAPALKMPIQ